MNEQEVIAFMEIATSAKDWDARVDEVKRRCSGYPDFWYSAIVSSGFIQKISTVWDEPYYGEIRVTPMRRL